MHRDLQIFFIDCAKAFAKVRHKNCAKASDKVRNNSLMQILHNLDLDGKDRHLTQGLCWRDRMENELSEYVEIKR